MIFNDRMIFIHIGKTGGMSCSNYLLNNLAGPVHSVHQEAAEEAARLGLSHIKCHSDLNRHCTLERGLNFIHLLTGRVLADYDRVVAVFRHPVTLEYSFYEHLKKPHVRERRKKNKALLDLANGDFLTFIKKAGYHRPGAAQQDFVTIDGSIPDCVTIVKFEQLTTQFPDTVSRFLKSSSPAPFPHNNRSSYQKPLRDQITPEVLAAVYEKHRFLFDNKIYELEDF